jgi:hypothetical protein
MINLLRDFRRFWVYGLVAGRGGHQRRRLSQVLSFTLHSFSAFYLSLAPAPPAVEPAFAATAYAAMGLV